MIYLLSKRPGGGDMYEAGTWHDYAGSRIHGDYTVTMDGQTPAIEEAVAHVPGLGRCDVAQPPSAGGAAYMHGNLVGTNERMTDSGAEVVRSAVYSAFGERVDGEQPPPAAGPMYFHSDQIGTAREKPRKRGRRSGEGR